MKIKPKISYLQAEERLSKIRPIVLYTQIRTGWIVYIRQLMNLTLEKLAQKNNVSKATIQQIEKREKDGKVTLATMKNIAHSMECDFIYAIVPKQQLSNILKQKALLKAKKVMEKADIHMSLEDQAVKSLINERIERMAEELLNKGDIW